MRLYIDLSPAEEANIAGWVNKGLSDPGFAAYPWRIVLEERTRARFDQIAAQFAVVAPPPVGGPEGDIRYGDTSRHEFDATTKEVLSWSFRVPVMPPGGWPGPNGAAMRLSLATYGGTDVLRRTCVSLVKGKLDDALFSQGKETPIWWSCGVELPQGALAYINTIALEEPPPGAARSSVSLIWPPLVYP